MKLNNRGFAISTIMYMILILAIILILATLSILSARKLVLDKLKTEVADSIYKGIIDDDTNVGGDEEDENFQGNPTCSLHTDYDGDNKTDVGDIIICTHPDENANYEEYFYFIDAADDGMATLLTYYNIDKVDKYWRQSREANEYQFSNKRYWSETVEKNIDISGSLIFEYVQEYLSFLNKLGFENEISNLLSKEQRELLGTHAALESISTPATYWLGYSYGSANYVGYIYDNGLISSALPTEKKGIRPVIRLKLNLDSDDSNEEDNNQNCTFDQYVCIEDQTHTNAVTSGDERGSYFKCQVNNTEEYGFFVLEQDHNISGWSLIMEDNYVQTFNYEYYIEYKVSSGSDYNYSYNSNTCSSYYNRIKDEIPTNWNKVNYVGLPTISQIRITNIYYPTEFLTNCINDTSCKNNSYGYWLNECDEAGSNEVLGLHILGYYDGEMLFGKTIDNAVHDFDSQIYYKSGSYGKSRYGIRPVIGVEDSKMCWVEES